MTLNEVRERLALEKKGIETLLKQARITLKKREGDKQEGLKSLQILKKSLKIEKNKEVVNIKLVKQVTEAIDTTNTLLEGVEEAIQAATKQIQNNEDKLSVYADLDALAREVAGLPTEPNIKEGRVIPFDKQRSTQKD